MSMKRLVQIMVVALLALAMPAQAVRRYKCDFESEASRARWTLNPVAKQSVLDKIDNRWYIGEPGNNDRNGHNGLYISDDGGQTAHYRNKGCWVFAYDTIALDHLESGDYTIFFDYCVMANIASNFDGLYLMWIPMVDQKGDSINVISIPTSSGDIPTQFEDYIIRLQPNANMDYLSGTVTWQQCVAKIPNKYCDGTKHYLAFAWANGSNQPQQPGGMIDNINITDNTSCNQPTNLTISQDGTTVSLTWQGDAPEYEVSAYSYDGQKWSGPKIVTTTATSFSGLPIGQTDFIVRAKCDDDFYSLKTIVSKLIYYPDQLCVDYLNLDNATCYVAATPSSDHPSTDTYNNFIVQREDHGPSSMSSFHTVHFDRTEYEPRTGYQAKTVPDNELASVRLGNWDDQEFAERIEFSFDVDTIKYPVFLLKYMPILEAPNHDDDENPRFMLDMLIGGTSIGRCGMADFNANNVRGPGGLTPEAVAQGWHITPPDQIEGSYTDIFWKDWTTVGVNLRKPAYQGKKLTVRLTTFDCVFNAHFGYAYFTLGCSDGKLKGMKCGAINPVFEAPDGFEYRWAYASSEKYRRKANDPTGPEGSLPEKYVLGRGQTYNAGYKDDSLYVVDCMFVQDSTCFFSLYASTLATNPISIMNEPVIYKHCQDSIYQVTFDASPSWVQEIDHVKGDTLVSKAYHIETYEWNIEGLPAGYEAWSDEKIHTFKFPLEGGDFDVSLRTSCGTCDSVIHYHLHLDPLGPTYTTQTYVLCDDVRKGEGFKWAERDSTYRTYGIVDSVNLYSTITTCDSIIYLELLEPQRIFVDTMLLPEDLANFEFHGKTYDQDTKSMIDTVPDPDDCSKTWVLNLEIYESLQINMVNSYELCEHEDTLRLIYEILRGRSLSYSYVFNNPAIPASGVVDTVMKKGSYVLDIILDPDLTPNIYQGAIVFEDAKPEYNATIPFTLSVMYSSDVITQRWNDVLAIRNADYNGGYRFDSVQWYVNGQPIYGANTFAYYIEEEGKTLRFGEAYQALLTRNDGTQLFTCPFIPAPVPEAEMPLPTLVNPNAPLHIQGRGVARWYDMLGRCHSTQSYDESDIVSPSAKGYYLLLLQGSDSREIHHMIVK